MLKLGRVILLMSCICYLALLRFYIMSALRKSLQNSDAYFLVQQQALEDLSAKQEKVNKLAKHLASIMGTQDIVS